MSYYNVTRKWEIAPSFLRSACLMVFPVNWEILVPLRESSSSPNSGEGRIVDMQTV